MKIIETPLFLKQAPLFCHRLPFYGKNLNPLFFITGEKRHWDWRFHQVNIVFLEKNIENVINNTPKYPQIYKVSGAPIECIGWHKDVYTTNNSQWYLQNFIFKFWPDDIDVTTISFVILTKQIIYVYSLCFTYLKYIFGMSLFFDNSRFLLIN